MILKGIGQNVLIILGPIVNKIKGDLYDHLMSTIIFSVNGK